jgi:hypothetical protein
VGALAEPAVAGYKYGSPQRWFSSIDHLSGARPVDQ